MELYDLVKVVECDIDERFIDGFGVINNVLTDIYGIKLYEILFVGEKTNKLSKKYGGVLFSENQLEGI